MDVRRILTQILTIETSLAKLYGWYSHAFETDREASTLFYRMARDEKSHESMIRYEKRILNNKNALLVEVDLDLKELVETNAAIKALLERREPPSLEEAVAKALRFENSAAENHLLEAVMDKAPTLQKLLSNLGKLDRKHYLGLVDFARSRGMPIPGEEKPS